MNKLEAFIERLLFASRWLLAPLYLGMSIVLLALVYIFFKEVYHIFSILDSITDTDVIVLVLTLVDILLVGGLVIMVMFSGYENFVSRIDLKSEHDKPAWLGQIDAGTLKLKVSASIVAISAVLLLRKYVEVEEILKRLPADASLTSNPLFWYTIMHLVFVISALMLAFVDKISFSSHRNHPKGTI